MKNVAFIKFRNFLVSFILLSFVTSCSNFLDEVNWSSQTADNLFVTADGYEKLINGCYADLRSIYDSKDFKNLQWLGTDIITQNNVISTNNLNQYTINYDSNDGSVGNLWNTLYSSLKNVNSAIGRAEKVKGLDEKILFQRVAEAKVLRALYLFHIVRNWSDAPLMLEEPKGPITTATRTPASEIYNQILKDLNDAISILPLRQTGENYGRLSASAARHLRSQVYLTRGYLSIAETSDFQNAYNDATDVITKSGHTLLKDYKDVHRQANEVNDEIIFSVQYGTDAVSGIGNSMPKYFLFPYREGYLGLAKDSYYGNDDASYMPTKYLYLLFNWQKDRRAEVTFMSPLNGNPATSIDGKNTGKNWFECVQEVEGTFLLGDTVIYFPVPSDPKFKYWTENDKSKVDFLVYNFPSGNSENYSEDEYYLSSYQTSNLNSRTFLPVWKFKDANTNYLESGASTGTRDLYVFRLAETYLIAAEAALKMGNNTNALTHINEIRKRAEKEPNSLVYSGGTQVTIDMILDERSMELFGEVSHWNDLQRTGKLIERVRKYNWDTMNIIGNIQTQLTENATKFYLRPIPLAWINSLENSDEIVNNPGW
ncbi:MAG: RagB/SusD family nutrient uptake outer membrane protein [Tissierellia bacterium]|nr:RagB/SusD family nutrient uptake outer membrane protein [Tissierellia bacterium]MDD4781869.1 RagB/SusD family nutrient uptake outer membrane protein [Tissierellia bacterium]